MRLYAFWPYEDYFLGGEVTEITNDGKVKIDGYGSSLFTPTMITSYIHGHKLHNELADIVMEDKKARDELRARFKAEVAALNIEKGGK